MLSGQPAGQLVQGVSIAGVRSLPQLSGLTALSQPAGQPELGHVLTGIGQWADHGRGLRGPAPVTKPAGQLPAGMIIAPVGPLAQLLSLVVLGQAVGLPPLGGILRLPSQ
jgi:hypothetical protein